VNWNLPKQTILVNREDPKAPPGDCWRCCVAALLQMPAADVPHFVQLSSSHEADTQRWLNERGFWLLAAEPKFIIHGWFGDTLDHVPLISCGPTPRSQQMGQHHAVVTVSDKVVYDPHPSEAGLTAITRQFTIVRMLPNFP
jgi:hypothetical protein